MCKESGSLLVFLSSSCLLAPSQIVDKSNRHYSSPTITPLFFYSKTSFDQVQLSLRHQPSFFLPPALLQDQNYHYTAKKNGVCGSVCSSFLLVRSLPLSLCRFSSVISSSLSVAARLEQEHTHTHTHFFHTHRSSPQASKERERSKRLKNKLLFPPLWAFVFRYSFETLPPPPFNSAPNT